MSRKSEIGNRKSDGRLSPDSRFPIAVSRPRERGYTMVAVVIGMTVMAILLMGVAPSIATIMKREREQELLFRGKQYARAIALFQKRYGRFPTEL
jgi:type II secretory pathway pseudopilin PulG